MGSSELATWANGNIIYWPALIGVVAPFPGRSSEVTVLGRARCPGIGVLLLSHFRLSRICGFVNVVVIADG